MYFSGLAFLCTLLQPYKERFANVLTSGLLAISSLICALSATVYNTHGNEVLFLVIGLILIPHCVLWGYVTWKITAALCCWQERKRIPSVNSNRMVMFDSVPVFTKQTISILVIPKLGTNHKCWQSTTTCGIMHKN